MARNLIIRGFDDDVHTQLGDLSRQKGVSINSIVKDAVDRWLRQQKEIPKRHHLLVYDNDESMQSLLKSIDRLAKEGEWFRCFAGPPDTLNTKLLKKLDWFDGTILPYFSEQKDTMRYCTNTMENIIGNSGNRDLCCMDFLINDIAKSSLKEATKIEKAYDENRLPGLMFCTYKTDNLLNASINDMMEIFDLHEQIFILKDEQVYKLHVTKENAHKLFLS